MPHIRIGCSGFPVKRKHYFKYLKVVEMRQMFQSLPKPATAEAWRRESPADFEFVAMAPAWITALPAKGTKIKGMSGETPTLGHFAPQEAVFEIWERTREVCHILESSTVLFQTPATFSPTREHESRLVHFFESINRDGLTMVWHPFGMWDSERVTALCADLKLMAACDPLLLDEDEEPPQQEISYFRIAGRGSSCYRFSEMQLSRLMDSITPCDAAYILFANVEMFNDAKRFKSIVESSWVQE